MKWPFVLLLTVILFGCAEKAPPEKEASTTTSLFPIIPIAVQSTTSTIIKSPWGIYELHPNEPIEIEGRHLKIIDIKTDGAIIINIDGYMKEIAETNTPLVFNGLEILAEQLLYGKTPIEHSVTLNIQPFVLQENEFYLFPFKTIEMGGQRLTVLDINRYGEVLIKIGNDNVVVSAQKSKEYKKLIITVKRWFFNSHRNERFIVLQIDIKA